MRMMKVTKLARLLLQKAESQRQPQTEGFLHRQIRLNFERDLQHTPDVSELKLHQVDVDESNKSRSEDSLSEPTRTHARRPNQKSL